MSLIDNGFRPRPPPPPAHKPVAKAEKAPVPTEAPVTPRLTSTRPSSSVAVDGGIAHSAILGKLNVQRAQDSGASTTVQIAKNLVPDGVGAAAGKVSPPKVDPRAAAAQSQVTVDQKQATAERTEAAAGVQGDADTLNKEASRIEAEANASPPAPNVQVSTSSKNGGKVTTETHLGADGKPDRVTTVNRSRDGKLTVTTTTPDGLLREQKLSTVNGKTVLDDKTVNLKDPFGKNPVAARHAETDGFSTSVSASAWKDGKFSATEDSWSTQQGTKGLRGEVKDGFDGSAPTEVHHHKTLSGNDDGISFSDTTTYSQGNQRVSRNANSTFPDGDSQVSWTQEKQEGNDYRAQTTIEGHPDVLIQVQRHADPSTGSVSERTVKSNPIDGTVQQQSQVDKSYDGQGRLTHQHEDTRDKDGNTAVHDYSAGYTSNADGTTSVQETTTADVGTQDGHHRVTREQVDSTDSKAGRQVNDVHTTVSNDGQVVLDAQGNGSSSTVQVNGKTLHFDANGEPADDATRDALVHDDKTLVGGLSGLNALQKGAEGSATGTTLTGPFASKPGVQKGIGEGTALLQFKLDQADDIDHTIDVFKFASSLGGGTDAAAAKDGVINGDLVRYVTEGKTLINDALNAKKVVTGLQATTEAADEAQATLGTFGRAVAVGGVVAGLATGAYDTYKAFTATNGLDRADAVISAAGAFGTAGVGIAALAAGGPPGWVAAAAALAIQVVVTEGHNIVDDERRGHDGEAKAETIASIFGTPIAGILLHAFFTSQDSDELRHHNIDDPLPSL